MPDSHTTRPVCSACLTEACATGILMCEKSRTAGIALRRAWTAAQPRTDSKADDPLGELRFELGARTRQLDQVRGDYRKLTEQVITALSTAEHHMTARGGLPFCECGISLGGGDASGSFITHILAVTGTRSGNSRCSG